LAPSGSKGFGDSSLSLSKTELSPDFLRPRKRPQPISFFPCTSMLPVVVFQMPLTAEYSRLGLSAFSVISYFGEGSAPSSTMVSFAAFGGGTDESSVRGGSPRLLGARHYASLETPSLKQPPYVRPGEHENDSPLCPFRICLLADHRNLLVVPLSLPVSY